jgi:methionyl-tRNA formyltransferase
MRLVVMGTPAFAVPSLERVVAAGHEVRLVVCQPDRPAGRGQRLQAPRLKAAALRLALPVAQPETFRDPAAVALLARQAPEAIAVVAYGQILPRAVLELAPHGCLNVHASLLPAYRGAAPIPRALLRGETETGITIIRLVERMDAGPMLLQRREAVRPDDTAGTLGERLAVLGAEALVEALGLLAAGRAEAREQDEAAATYAPKLTAADQVLNWKEPAAALHRRVRALAPQPGAQTTARGRLVKVLAAEAREGAPARWQGEEPGTVVALAPEGILVRAGEGCLLLTRVQAEGKRPMAAADFARGARLDPGARLGPPDRGGPGEPPAPGHERAER